MISVARAWERMLIESRVHVSAETVEKPWDLYCYYFWRSIIVLLLGILGSEPPPSL
jgi:hypothetical protein